MTQSGRSGQPPVDPLRDDLHGVTPPAGGEPWGPPPEQGGGDDDTRPLQQARLPRQPGGPERQGGPEQPSVVDAQGLGPVRPLPQADPQPMPQAGAQSFPQADPQPMPQADPQPMPQAGAQSFPQADPQPFPLSDPQPLPSYGPGPSQPLPPHGAGPGQHPAGPAWPAAGEAPGAGPGPGAGQPPAWPDQAAAGPPGPGQAPAWPDGAAAGGPPPAQGPVWPTTADAAGGPGAARGQTSTWPADPALAGPSPAQGQPPAWPAADEAATELIAPITADSPPPYDLPGAPPAPPGGQAYGMPYEEPGRPAGRHGRDDFAALYRDSAPAGDPGATQQMPRVPAAPAAAYEQPPGGHDEGPGGPYYDDGPRRSIPRWAMVALATAACVAVGLTAGWLMSSSDSGDDGGKQAAHSPTAEATEARKSSAPPPDPAKEQAKKLDSLLATSNSSRSTVVRSVANIRACRDLSKAAKDLRGAARKRNDLVTRLGSLATDKLPDHGRLTSSLSAAWKASASADSHYAAWASQMAGHHGCRHGKSRPTDQLRAGNRASGTATTNKRKAASLWNPIARKYGLTARQPTQL